MLKKLGIAAVIASVMTVGAAGVAYAGDYDDSDHKSDHKSHDSGDDSDDDDDSEIGIDCSSHEVSEQNNYGKQLIGGNISLKNITGFIGGVIEKPAVCPKVLNDNEINF